MTPMPNAPNPNAIFGEALARTPAPAPLSTVQEQLAQTRGLNAQVPIQQQTAQELALKNQLTQRAINNANLIKANAGRLLDASHGVWDDSVRKGLIDAGVDADEAEKVTGAHYVNDEAFARTSQIREAAKKTTLENIDHANTQAAKIAVSLQQAYRPDKTIDLPMLEAQLQNIKKQNPDYDGDYVRSLAKDPEKFAAVMGGAIARAPDVAQGQQDLLKSHYETERAGSEAQIQAAAAQKAQFETQIRQSIAQQLGLPNVPGAPVAAAATLNKGVAGARIPFIADAVSREINERTNPEDYAEAYGAEVNQFINSGGDTSKLGAETHKIAERGAALREAKDKALFEKTNPQIVGAETQREINTRVGVQRALAGSGAFSSITDPTARNKAIGDTEKFQMEYADKVGAARQLEDFINLAQQNGNKAAPGMIGIAELKTLLNRVNRQELQAVGPSAGDAWDRIQAFTGKWSQGQPIPPDILRDTKILGSAIERAAKRTRDLKAQTVGQTYGIAPPPAIEIPPAETNAPAPTALPRGNGKVIDRATAQRFYEAAGNDPAKARQLATSNGWKLQ